MAAAHPSTITYEINLPSYTYTLTGAAGDDYNTSGDLDILANMSINGEGAGSTIIDGGGIDRVFHIPMAGPSITLSISNVTIQNGKVTGVGGGFDDDWGGGIYNEGSTLVISSSTITSNMASERHGGIHNRAGTLIISDSTISNNQASDFGGGISSSGSSIIGTDTVTITNCAIINNAAGADWGRGGGVSISTDVGTASISNSTIAGNTAGSGGGINNEHYGHAGGPDPVLNISNSTISGNTAGSDGGGIRVMNGKGTINLANVTIANNIADFDDNGSGDGGGIYHESGTLNIRNTIVAGNNDRSGGGPDCSGTLVSEQHNLIGINSGCSASFPAGLPNGNNDFVGTGGLPVNPHLSGLLGYRYRALLPGSPAIDGGNPAGCTDCEGNPLTTDQRGTPRPLDGDGDGDAICDIGAYEVDPDHPVVQVFLPAILRNCCPDFFDDFSNPASGWEVVDDSYVRTEYLNGEYRILTKQAGHYYLFGAPTWDRQDYVVAVDARWVGTPGNGYGLIFGVTSGFEQYYLFDMNTDYRQFRLLRRDSSGFTVVVPITDAPAINGGTASNHLKAIRSGDQITLEVNGTVLGTWTEGTIGGLTGAGLVTNPYSNNPTSDVRFDNFSMASLPGSGASAREPSGGMVGESELAVPDALRDPAPSDLGWR